MRILSNSAPTQLNDSVYRGRNAVIKIQCVVFSDKKYFLKKYLFFFFNFLKYAKKYYSKLMELGDIFYLAYNTVA